MDASIRQGWCTGHRGWEDVLSAACGVLIVLSPALDPSQATAVVVTACRRDRASGRSGAPRTASISNSSAPASSPASSRSPATASASSASPRTTSCGSR